MILLLTSLGLLGLGAVLALPGRGAAGWASRLAPGAAVAGCALGMIPAVQALAGNPEELLLPWSLPFGSFHLALDPLSGVFLLPLFLLSGAAAAYGVEYLRPEAESRDRGRSWFFFNLLVASMVVVVVARNAVLFLVAWEIMALTSFFLVTRQDESAAVRDAGVVYLIAAHLGTAFLLVLFLLLGHEAGSLEFEAFSASGAAGPDGALFLLALVGFGAKAGFFPLHVWLPEAHPVAPSHVSALMSGVMIKMGVYGLVRTLSFLGHPPPWWGWALLVIGFASGVGGVLFALAQHDLKRLLAYHSVENIGIIALGLGVGVLGQSAGSPVVAALGYAGALLHVVNHALFKGLLFLAAGAVKHSAHTLQVDELGGLLRRMPRTGVLFLVGAVAITGLPPLNGFISEFLVFLGAFRGVGSLGAAAAVAMALAIGGLALVSGLALACFAKAFGVVFLGEPRTSEAAHARDPGWLMVGPMGVLAAGCLAVAAFAPLVVRSLGPAVAVVAGPGTAAALGDAAGSLHPLVLGMGALVVLTAGLALLRRGLLRGRVVESGPTWDCGYAAPDFRMQYSGSSFAEPLTTLFRSVLRPREWMAAPEGYFPVTASVAQETPDAARGLLFRPLFRALAWSAGKLRWLQRGSVHLYIGYIVLALLAVLAATVGR